MNVLYMLAVGSISSHFLFTKLEKKKESSGAVIKNESPHLSNNIERNVQEKKTNPEHLA